MKKLFTAIFITVFAFTAFAQNKETPKEKGNNVDKTLMKLAEATLKAHGGEKLKGMKTLTVIGKVDVTASVFQQQIPATFVTIFAGDKYRLEINNPFQPLKQTFDGERTYSNLNNGFTMPPLNRLGFPLLPMIGETGFDVLALPEEKKGKDGFRIVSPEGYYTDFYLNKKTGQLKGYDSTFVSNGRTVTTSVEIDKFKTVDGVVIPEKYAQRFDLQQMTVYADFKATEIIVNKEIADEIFVLN
jgi:hypothetical protein